jgi:urease accessory protein
MNSLTTPKATSAARHWRGQISLGIEARANKSVLVHTQHLGPLRVQRPFYPESDGCCHIYLLHPPGGLVIGDELEIGASLAPKAQALLTTPSAGKIYGAKNRSDRQIQNINMRVAEGACLEWLPQETIVFDSAQAQLKTRVDIEGSGLFFGWDIVRLGRAASGEVFNTGSCNQNIEIWKNDRPLLIEKNRIEKNKSETGNDLHKANWGLRDSNTTGTLYATMTLTREAIDLLYTQLEAQGGQNDLWGLTQKEEIFIARYLGTSITCCRKGFELIWLETREAFNNKKAIPPRIWNT